MRGWISVPLTAEDEQLQKRFDAKGHRVERWIVDGEHRLVIHKADKNRRDKRVATIAHKLAEREAK